MAQSRWAATRTSVPPPVPAVSVVLTAGLAVSVSVVSAPVVRAAPWSTSRNRVPSTVQLSASP